MKSESPTSHSVSRSKKISKPRIDSRSKLGAKPVGQPLNTSSVSEMVAEARKHFVGQDENLPVIADYFFRARRGSALLSAGHQPEEILGATSLLLIGPSGSGKTGTIRKMAEMAGVYLHEVSVADLLITGPHAKNPSDVFGAAISQSGGDLDPTKPKVIFYDELDKTASRNPSEGDKASAIQFALLKQIEGVPVEVFYRGRKKTINTANFPKIFAGAFNGLSEVISRRINRSALGFATAECSKMLTDSDNVLQHVTVADLVEYGLKPELIARLGSPVTFRPLGEHELKQAVRKDSSVVGALRREFADYGILLEITEDGLDQLAMEAASLTLGARGIRVMVENKFGRLLARLGEMSGIQRIIVNAGALRGDESPVIVAGSPLVSPRVLKNVAEDDFGLSPEMQRLFPPGSIPRRPSRYSAGGAAGVSRMANTEDLKQIGVI